LLTRRTSQFNIPRHRLVLLTKCNGLVEDAPPAADGTPAPADKRATRDYVNQSGLSRAAIFNAVEASLARLETPYIDLLQIHRADFVGSTPEVGRPVHAWGRG
jgi:aryl-alcohol dehydrogenase-like predicted oxidoreductase